MLNPVYIDPIAFAKDEGTLNGTFSLAMLDERVRNHEYLTHISAEGLYLLVGGKDKLGRFFLDLSIELDLPLICQRCLSALPFRIEQTSRIHLFFNEKKLDEAMIQDEELEGVLVEEQLGIQTLIEDEILMALPFSPKHDHCDNPDLDKINQDKQNPFSVLTNLKS